MTNLEKAKEIVLNNINYAMYGIYSTPSIMPDCRFSLYNENDLLILICYEYGYFEVFGLSNDEFTELKNFYENLIEMD